MATPSRVRETSHMVPPWVRVSPQGREAGYRRCPQRHLQGGFSGSGEAARYENPLCSGTVDRPLTAYFDLVNQRGGIHGRKITIILKDDKYEPDPAVQNTNELIERDKVFFLFDYVGTPTLTRVLPLLKYYEAQKIVNVAPFTGADPQRTAPYDRFVFNIRASYREETLALVRYLYNQGYRRIGFLGQADAYGKSGEIGVNAALGEKGLKIVKSVTYPRNQIFERAMTAQVKLLRDAGVQAVVAVGVYAPCAAFVRDARLSGWTIPIANVSFVGPTALLDKLRQTSQQLKVDLTANLINSQVVPSTRRSALSPGG